MKTSLRFLFAALALLAFVFYAGPTSASAKVCANITIINNTTVAQTVCLITNPPGLIPCTVVPAGGSVLVPANTPVLGITSSGGLNYNWQPNPAPPPPQWAPNITLGGLCVDVYFDIFSCTVTIVPTTSAPPCRP